MEESFINRIVQFDLMNIPKDAKNSFKGKYCDVYEYPQIAPDGKKKLVYESVVRRPTVHVIAVREGKISLSHERQAMLGSFYSCFGGLLEKGEIPLEGAKRELLEESGLESDQWEHYTTFKTGPFVIWHAHYFIARNCRKISDQHLDPGEDVRVEEYSFEDWFDIITGDNFRNRDIALHLFKLQKKGLLDDLKKKLLGEDL